MLMVGSAHWTALYRYDTILSDVNSSLWPHILRICSPRRIIAYDPSIVATSFLGPHRLTVRTLGSHPGNPGSIPGEVTKVKAPLPWGFYFGIVAEPNPCGAAAGSKTSATRRNIFRAWCAGAICVANYSR